MLEEFLGVWMWWISQWRSGYDLGSRLRVVGWELCSCILVQVNE